MGRFVTSDSALITASGLSLLCSPLVQDANERSLLSALYVYPHVTLNFMPTPLYYYGFRPLEAIVSNFNWHPWNSPHAHRNPWPFKWAFYQIRLEFCFTEILLIFKTEKNNVNSRIGGNKKSSTLCSLECQCLLVAAGGSWHLRRERCIKYESIDSQSFSAFSYY